MATKERLRQYLETYENEHRKNCMNFKAACPVEIKFCDASGYGRSFSEAIVEYILYPGLHLAYFQINGPKKLDTYFKGETDRTVEISRLEEFIANKQHEACLLSMLKHKEYNDYNILVILAAHLFGPLAGNYTIGNKGFPKDARRCPECKEDFSEKLDNTSLGHGDVWHGYADILVKRSVVKVETEDHKTNVSGEPEDGSGEPMQKKMKTESFRDESYDSDSVVEVKKDAISGHAVSQILAQTIVNAFAEVKKNRMLSSSFIPSFIATSRAIRITMYNCELDSLIMTDDLKIFISDKDKITLDVSTILGIWYALNFQNYFDNSNSLFPEFQTVHIKSTFKEQAGKKFEIYTEKCTKPMTEAEGLKEVDFTVLGLHLSGSVGCEIETTLSSLRQLVHKKPLMQC